MCISGVSCYIPRSYHSPRFINSKSDVRTELMTYSVQRRYVYHCTEWFTIDGRLRVLSIDRFPKREHASKRERAPPKPCQRKLDRLAVAMETSLDCLCWKSQGPIHIQSGLRVPCHHFEICNSSLQTSRCLKIVIVFAKYDEQISAKLVIRCLISDLHVWNYSKCHLLLNLCLVLSPSSSCFCAKSGSRKWI